MVACKASDHNFFRRLIGPRTTVARTCFSPSTGAATPSPPCSTSSPWRGWPVSTPGDGPPEALTRASARKEIKATRKRSHHLAAIGLRARIRHRVVADNTPPTPVTHPAGPGRSLRDAQPCRSRADPRLDGARQPRRLPQPLRVQPARYLRERNSLASGQLVTRPAAPSYSIFLPTR